MPDERGAGPPATSRLGGGIDLVDVLARLPTGVRATDPTAHARRPAGHHYLLLDGVGVGFLTSVKGGSIYADVLEEPGPEPFVEKHLGQIRYEEFALGVGFAMDPSFFVWVAASWAGDLRPLNGAVVGVDFDLKPRSQADFFGAVVTGTAVPGCDAASKGTGELTIRIASQRISYVPAHDVPPMSLGKSSQRWSPSNFRLEIPELDTSKVSKIEPFEVDRPSSADGPVSFPDLRVTLAESSVETWVEWHRSFIIDGNNGPESEREGRLVFLAPNRQDELGEIGLKGLGIHQLSAADPHVEQALKLVAHLYCQRMELRVPPGT